LLGAESVIISFQFSDSQLLVGTATGSHLFDTRSRQLVGHFPACAKLVGNHQAAPQGCR
jgi:hypothetical protein